MLENAYFMKFCSENNSENCKKNQCQYKIYCSRYKWLVIQETKNKINEVKK